MIQCCARSHPFRPGNPKCTEKLAIAQRRYGEGGTGGPNAGGTKATMKKRPAPGATGGGTPPSKSKPKPKPVDATADGSFAAVLHVADEGYEAHRNANPRTFMMFYAPWCGNFDFANFVFVFWTISISHAFVKAQYPTRRGTYST